MLSGLLLNLCRTCRNPLKTGLVTASRDEMSRSDDWRAVGRNPLKTGLVTARGRSVLGWATPMESRNPLKTGLVTASNFGGPGRRDSGDTPGRNPLKTGLVTARRWKMDEFLFKGGRHSQSPENGSRHCKLHLVAAFLQEEIQFRNPLKTGLVTASCEA